MFYVEWSLERSPFGWLTKSEHTTLTEAENALEKLLADSIHDSDPQHWRIYEEK